MTKSEILSREELEKFMKKSKVDIFAQRGLGKVTTAVDGFVELFSALLYKAGIDVGGLELERWLDCYYQLRYEAEREADLAKFVAEQIKSADKLEPVVPKLRFTTGPAIEDRDDDGEKPVTKIAIKAAGDVDCKRLTSLAAQAIADTILKRFESEATKEEKHG